VAAGPRSEAEFFFGAPQIVVEKEGHRAVSIMSTLQPNVPANPTRIRNTPRSRVAQAVR
jgi:hypothetical protein